MRHFQVNGSLSRVSVAAIQKWGFRIENFEFFHYYMYIYVSNSFRENLFNIPSDFNGIALTRPNF